MISPSCVSWATVATALAVAFFTMAPESTFRRAACKFLSLGSLEIIVRYPLVQAVPRRVFVPVQVPFLAARIIRVARRGVAQWDRSMTWATTESCSLCMGLTGRQR